MNFGHRVRIVYVKELIDILRDRRTLIAMIVVPIVLYPLLMLGSIQAVSLQSEELRKETFSIGVLSKSDMRLVKGWIEDQQRVARALREREAAEAAGQAERDEEEPLPDFSAHLEVYDSREDLELLIRNRRIQLALLVEVVNAGNPLLEQHLVTRLYDPEETLSATAAYRFQREVLAGRSDVTVLSRLDHFQIPEDVIEPFIIEDQAITTPGSILGQIVPLILVLMTITGAIYPAIDLTAGERERGTLETLMVCPVPVLDLVVGKFLVVTTVAIMGAALNLASVSATVYFGGFESVVNASGDEGFPVGVLPLILLALVPFAILMSAIMIAVCSYARTFKEAQNYVTPVILAVLIPGGIAAFPATRLEGVMLVMPVGNMVLLTRELLLGSHIGVTPVVYVLLSTSLYALSAVAVAAKVFGTESVVFSDSASIKSSLMRRYLRPVDRPSLSVAVLIVALLFPVWFYVQTRLQATEDVVAGLRRTLELMPAFFVLLPVAICLYFKIDLRRTFALRAPAGRFLLAALLIGVSGWAPARELAIAQRSLISAPTGLEAAGEVMQRALEQFPAWLALLLLAVLPAISEEMLFRGFLLSGLRSSMRKWPVLLATACAFGVFHYYVFRFPVTALLGLVLAYLCWQSGSLWPAVLAHALHNATAVIMALRPGIPTTLGIDDSDPWAHLPLHVVIPACALLIAGLLLARKQVPPASEPRP